MALFDTHTHLDAACYDGDRERVIARAVGAGVTRMLVCGADLASSEAAMALAGAQPHLWAAVGVHPHEARTVADLLAGERLIDALGAWADDPRVVAVGEVGLDYHYDHSPRELQRRVLAAQLAAAAALRLPVVVHCREAEDDLRRVVDSAPEPPGGVLHCFSGRKELADWALARGWYLGVAGPVTYPRADALRAVLAEVPLDRLLIETDCPYLAPQPARGKRNEPAFVVHVADALAALHGVEARALAERTSANASRLFGLN